MYVKRLRTLIFTYSSYPSMCIYMFKCREYCEYNNIIALQSLWFTKAHSAVPYEGKVIEHMSNALVLFLTHKGHPAASSLPISLCIHEDRISPNAMWQD